MLGYFQSILLNAPSNRQCDMLFVWKAPVKHHFSMAVKKNSTYFKKLNEALLIMQESGQLYNLQKLNFKQFEKCQYSNFNRVGHDKMGSLFIILAFIIVLSFCLWVLEVFMEEILYLVESRKTEPNNRRHAWKKFSQRSI